MTFVQLVTLTTDRIEEILELDAQWRRETAGRSTVLRECLYRDANAPGRYVSVVEFDSAAAAARNSALPETAAGAARIGELAGEVGFADLELVTVLGDRRADLVAGLLDLVATAKVPDDVFADGLVCDVTVPFARFVLAGADAVADAVRHSAPAGSTIEEHSWSATPDGFVVEFASRAAECPGKPGTYARQLAWARVRDGRIDRLAVYCGGDWDADTEARNAL